MSITDRFYDPAVSGVDPIEIRPALPGCSIGSRATAFASC